MIEALLELKRSTVRFVIISVVPNRIAYKIKNLSQELSGLSGSKNALLYPPHITIRTGAIVPIDNIDAFVLAFRKDVDKFNAKVIYQEPLTISEIDFINYTDEGQQKHLIAYRVRKTEWLVELNKTLDESNEYKKTMYKTFHPHISLAYGDLSTFYFNKLKDHILDNKEHFCKSLSFDINDVSLFYQLDNGYWKEYCSFSLREK